MTEFRLDYRTNRQLPLASLDAVTQDHSVPLERMVFFTSVHSKRPVSEIGEMTYTVSSETLNPSIPYHTIKPQ